MKTRLTLVALCLAGACIPIANAQPTNFDAAKRAYLTHVYHDRMVTTYCGCEFTRRGASGGVIDLSSCGVELPSDASDFAHVRANRLEAEHIVPISRVTVLRSCGTRSDCVASDREYNLIYSDIHNLTPSVGYINAERSNYAFTELPHIGWDDAYGQCNFKVDHRNRLAEPPDHLKGFIARVYGYMMTAYGLPIDEAKQRQFIRWSNMYPPSEWEIERDRRIAGVMGWHNPFVTGEKVWDRIYTEFTPFTGIHADNRRMENPTAEMLGMPIRGNRNSRIYHKYGCPSYNAMAPQNVIEFESEREAIAQGFRLAKNCN